MQALGELAQLAAGRQRLLAGGAEQPRGPRRVGLQLAQREVQRVAEHDQSLLRAVVQVAPDPQALLVGGLQDRQLLVLALELGRGPGGEDPQRLQLGRGGPERRPARDHADVADRAAAASRSAIARYPSRPWARRNWSRG